jgi:PIN domain nuclease of toxin-antitoxin system
MRNARVVELPLSAAHAAKLATLPLHHRDPFDRMLVATAMLDNLTLLTDDPEIRKYAVQTAW